METIIESLIKRKGSEPLTQEQLKEAEEAFKQQISKVQEHLTQISGVASFGGYDCTWNFRDRDNLIRLTDLVACIKDKAEVSEKILEDLFELIDKLKS